jgi:transketolase
MTYEATLHGLCAADPRIVVMTAENRAAIRNLPALLGERFIDVGICEQTMVGMAAGLALRGRIPVVHALATFLTLRAFEFIRTDIGIGQLPVKLIGGVPGFLSEANGPTHQALEDVAILRSIPGMQIICPSDGQELERALPAILASTAPTYVRFNARPAVVPHRADFTVGKAEVVSQGRDVAFLVAGFLLEEADRARAILVAQGLSVRLVNLRSLAPVDSEEIVHCAHATRLLVTIEDHFLVGGLRSIVAEILLNAQVTCPVLSLALDARWFQPALLPDVLVHEGFTGVQIASRVRAALERKPGGTAHAKRGRHEYALSLD